MSFASNRRIISSIVDTIMTSMLEFYYRADNSFVLLLTGLEHTSLIHFVPYNAVGMFGTCN